ncbi:MAG: hypothetical protein AAF466_00050 [Bacteroidota bacterium]
MKTKISLILLVSIFVFGFTSEQQTIEENAIDIPVDVLNALDLSTLEALASNEADESMNIAIEWTGSAVHGLSGYNQVRMAVRLFYETNYNKSIFSQMVDNNHEVWLFLSGDRSDVEAAMAKDDDVAVDDD